MYEEEIKERNKENLRKVLAIAGISFTIFLTIFIGFVFFGNGGEGVSFLDDLSFNKDPIFQKGLIDAEIDSLKTDPDYKFDDGGVSVNKSSFFIEATPHTAQAGGLTYITISSKLPSGNYNLVIGGDTYLKPHHPEWLNETTIITQVFNATSKKNDSIITVEREWIPFGTKFQIAQYKDSQPDDLDKPIAHIFYNLYLEQGVKKTIRYAMDTPPYKEYEAKYDIGFYPSIYGSDIATAESLGFYYVLDPFVKYGDNDMLLTFGRTNGLNSTNGTFDNSWTGQQTAIIKDGTPGWVNSLQHPFKKEMVIGTIFRAIGPHANLSMVFYNGTSYFGSTILANISAVTLQDENFAFGYESQSGDLIVVYNNGSISETSISYQTYSNGVWTDGGIIQDILQDVLKIDISSSPTRDEMILTYETIANDIYSWVWNGTDWGNNLTLTTQDESGTTMQKFDSAWESDGNRAVVMFDEEGTTSDLKKIIWNRTDWGASNEQGNLSNMADIQGDLRLVSAPNHNYIVGCFRDDLDDVFIFDLNSTLDANNVTEPDTQANHNVVAFDCDAVFYDTDDKFAFFWASSTDGQYVNNAFFTAGTQFTVENLVAVRADFRSGEEMIALATIGAGSDLHTNLWNSTADTFAETLDHETNLATVTAFDININQVNFTDPLIDCGILSTANSVTTMNQNVSSSGSCFTITAENITLECAGFSIDYATASAGNGVNITSSNNATVQNCLVNENGGGGTSNDAISVISSANATIKNNTIVVTEASSRGILLSSGSENKVLWNRITTAGSGAEGIQLDSSSTKNIVYKNNATTSGTTSEAIRVDTASGNNFTKNRLTTTNSDSAEALRLQRAGTSIIYENFLNATMSDGIILEEATANANNFTNNTIVDNGQIQLIFRLDKVGANDTLLTDQYLTNYTLQNNTLKIVDTQFGEITFTGRIDGTGSNLSNDIRITNNSAIVESVTSIGLNTSANISLFGILTSFTDPRILRDDVICDTTTNPRCSNFTSLNAGTVKFNVTSWTNYSIGESGIESDPPNVTALIPINNTEFNLTQSIEISANVSDSSEINSVFANITLPNGTVTQLTLSNLTFLNKYNTSYVVPILGGDYNVTYWANDSMGNINNSESTNFTAYLQCGTLSSAGQTYSLTRSLTATLDCFTITAENITLDGAGYSISGDGGLNDEGIISTADNLTIRGLNVSKFWDAIDLTNSKGHLIYNNTLESSITSGLFLSGITTSRFLNNTIIGGSGTGIKLNFGNDNNNFTGNNVLGGITMLKVDLSDNNTFSGGILNGTNGNAIDIGGAFVASYGNRFENISIRNIQITGLYFNSFVTGNNRTVLQDIYIQNYSFTGDGDYFFTVNKTAFGEIMFLQNVSGSGVNMSNDILIQNNSITINNPTNFNFSANITLHDVYDRGFSNPQILLDGSTICDATTTPRCENFTSLTAENVKFNTTSWASNFSIGSTPDAIPPSVTALTEIPADPATYSPGQLYKFNATITDGGTLETIRFEFNGTNRTVNNVSSVYNSSVTNLAVGTFSYSWYANDTGGNVNSTEAGTYTVNRAVSEVNLSINNSESNITIANGSTIDLNGTLITGDSGATILLYKNGTLINNGTSPLGNSTLFSNFGIHNISIVYPQSQNYTRSAETFYVEVISDSIPPNVTALIPIENSAFGVERAIEISANFSDDTKVNLIFANVTLPNGTVNKVTLSNLSFLNKYNNSYTIPLLTGVYNVTFIGNDSVNNLNVTETTNFTAFIDCGDLNDVGQTYTLTRNINTSGTCFNILADNITIEGAGFTVNYSQSAIGYAINNSFGFNQTTINNVVLLQGGTSTTSHAINIVQGENMNITNSRIDVSGTDTYGVHLFGANTNYVFNNNITVRGSSTSKGIWIEQGSDPSTVLDNRIDLKGTNTDADPLRGIEFWTSDNARIINNTITGGDTVAGILIFQQGAIQTNTEITNNTITLPGPTAFGLSLLASGSNVSGNTFNISGNTPNNNSAVIVFDGRDYGTLVDEVSNNFIHENTFNTQSANLVTFLMWENVTNNVISDNSINGTSLDLIRYTRNGGTILGEDNNFSNNSLPATLSGFDLNVVIAGFNGTYIEDQLIRNYTINQSIAYFKNSTFGQIRFLENLNGAGEDLSTEIFFGNNSASVTASTQVGFNTSANVTLYDIYDRGFTTPAILLDGATVCDTTTTPRCSNFTSLVAENVKFNVTSWQTNYSIGEGFIPVFSPNVTSLTENPSDPATYVQGATYEFNATVVDDGIVANVSIEFNGTNSTLLIDQGAGVYNFTTLDLAVGTFSYSWYANDTGGNVNATEIGTYTINRATSEVNLSINNSESNITINQGDTIDLNGTQISGDSGHLIQLYNNGTLINNGTAPIGNSTLFNDLGEHNITIIYIQSQNYTRSSESFFVNVVAIDSTPPVLTNFQFLAINSSLDQIGTDETSFNSSNMQEIEYMNISFTVSDASNVSGDINLLFTANGSTACSLGNNQSTTCFNWDGGTWIDFKNGTNTARFLDFGNPQGDRISCDYTQTNATSRLYTCEIDEHYNPNIWKHYPLNFSNTTWESGTGERIRNNQLWRVNLTELFIPTDALLYKLDFRVNTTVGQTPSQPIIAYLCNSTYTTGDPAFASTCQLVASKNPTDLQDDGSKFRGEFTLNLTQNLGDIGFAVITSDSPPSKYYSMKTYQPLGGQTTRVDVSSDNGDTYSALSTGFETELNLNWFYKQSATTNVTQTLFMVGANDTLGNIGNSSEQVLNWIIEIENLPPVVNIMVPEENATVNNTIEINWTTADPNGDPYTTNVTAFNGTDTTNIILELSDSFSNTTWDTTTVNTGPWNLTVESCETSTTELFCGNATHPITITVTELNPPNVTSLTEAPADPATYVQGATYEFNATVLDEGTISTVSIEFNGTNTTLSDSGSGVYNFTILDLQVGTFSYSWYVNDTLGNTNFTEGGTYTISRATSVLNLTLNGTQGNITIGEGATINLNASILSGDSGEYIQLYNNETFINNGTSPIFNSTLFNDQGIFNITTIYLQTQNFTRSSLTYFINVTTSAAGPVRDLQRWRNNLTQTNVARIDSNGNFFLQYNIQLQGCIKYNCAQIGGCVTIGICL